MPDYDRPDPTEPVRNRLIINYRKISLSIVKYRDPDICRYIPIYMVGGLRIDCNLPEINQNNLKSTGIDRNPLDL